MRIAAADEGGAITVRWDDRSTVETSYAVSVRPADVQSRANIGAPPGSLPLTNGGFAVRLNGAGVQQFVHHPSGPGTWVYQVQACNADILHGTAPASDLQDCGPVGSTLGSNIRPTVPTGLSFSHVTVKDVGANGLAVSVASTQLNWASQVGAIEYVVHIAPKPGTPGSPTDTRTTATSSPAVATVVAKTDDWSVAACNRVGCSTFSSPISP